VVVVVGRYPRRPDWTQSSVDYVREVAERQLCTAKCVFYRAEPEFLLQGGMPAVIKPNQKTTPGPMMVQGMVGWAGEFMGTCAELEYRTCLFRVDPTSQWAQERL